MGTIDLPTAMDTAVAVAVEELTRLVVQPAPVDEGGSEPGADAWHAEIPLRRAKPGRLQLIMPASTLTRLAEQFLPTGSTFTNELLLDWLGELANVTAGQMKTVFKGSPWHFHLGTPLTGSAIPRESGDWLTRAYVSEAGPLHLRVQLEPCDDA